MTDPAPLTDEELAVNFYRCPNTGDLVYRWADERLVLVPSDEIAALRARRAEVDKLQAEVKALRDEGYRTHKEWYEDYARW